jgi:hypothetical protein
MSIAPDNPEERAAWCEALVWVAFVVTLAAGLGWLALSLALFALAATGLLCVPAMVVLLTGAILLCRRELRAARQVAVSAAGALWRRADRFSRLLAGLWVAPALLSLVPALTPPHDSDSLRYHLPLPQLYLRSRAVRLSGQEPFRQFPPEP